MYIVNIFAIDNFCDFWNYESLAIIFCVEMGEIAAIFWDFYRTEMKV